MTACHLSSSSYLESVSDKHPWIFIYLFSVGKIVFLCLFNFRAFSFWTWFTFILVVLSNQLGGKTHPLCLLQPGGELLGAAACGGTAIPKKGDRNQSIDATHGDAARQHFAMCTVSGVNPRISDTFHQSTTSSPVCRYPYCRGWGNLGRKSL